MKAVNASFHHYSRLRSLLEKIRIPVMAASLHNIMALTWAGLVAVAIITLSVWSVGMEISTYLGVSAWGLGFVFLALAVDNNGQHALYQAISGVALLVLAMLQASVATEFFIVSGVILAAWVARIIFGFLSVQTR
jgi:hypothetical protein